MTRFRARWTALLLAVGMYCLVFAARPSQAEILTPPAMSFLVVDGVSTDWGWNQTGKALGGDVFSYNGNVTKTNYQFEWNITADPDPWVNSNYTITNNTLTTNIYTVTVSLPIIPIPGSTLTGGSVQGGVTDNNGDGATLGQVGVTPLYMSLIDGVDFTPLLPPGTSSITVGPFLSGTVGPSSFGTPIPSLPGPAASTSIGIRLNFTLTPGDSASFTSVFVVEPVPEPASIAMASCGFAMVIGGVCWRRRRARHSKQS
ncbi:MAG: hypothetical protein AB7U73_03455 [Pirellulales bacterium]